MKDMTNRSWDLKQPGLWWVLIIPSRNLGFQAHGMSFGFHGKLQSATTEYEKRLFSFPTLGFLFPTLGFSQDKKTAGSPPQEATIGAGGVEPPELS